VAGSLVEGSLQFHKKCGKLVKLSTNRQTARRQKYDYTNLVEHHFMLSSSVLLMSTIMEWS